LYRFPQWGRAPDFGDHHALAAPARAFPPEDLMADEMTALRDRQDKLEGRAERLEVIVEREAMLRARMDEDQSKVTETLKAHKRGTGPCREGSARNGRQRFAGEGAVRSEAPGPLAGGVTAAAGGR
jgi:hypothetical protein